MVYVMGLCCVAWTIVELLRLTQEAHAMQQAQPVRQASSRPSAPHGHVGRSGRRFQREPLAAWDERGRPIFVEDVSIRGAR